MAFDDFMDPESGYPSDSEQKPIYAIDLSDDQEVLKWLLQEMEHLKKVHRETFDTQKVNLSVYRNDQLQVRKMRTENSTNDLGLPLRSGPRVTINHVYDTVEAKVAMMSRLKPAVEVLPRDDQHADKVGAKIAKKFIEHLWYVNDVDSMIQKAERLRYILGEVFIKPYWCDSAGDFHPAYAALRKGSIKTTVNERGQTVIETSNGPVVIDGPIKTGDVAYELVMPWRVLLEDAECFDKVNFSFEIQKKDIEELRREYPQVANKIKGSNNSNYFNMATMKSEKLRNQVMVFEFVHKKTKYVPEGLRIKFTEHTILSQESLGYEHGELDLLHYTDVDFPDQLHGVSVLEQIKELQSFNNNLTNMYAKHAWLLAHPKWLVPKGACKIDSLANEVTVVEWKGALPPQLAVINPISNDILVLSDKMEQKINQMMAVHGISNGNPPPGITAAVALQFLNDQEAERNSTDIAKHNALVQKLAKRSLAIAGQFYDPEDGRTIRVLGEDGKYLAEQLDLTNFHKDYDVVINNATALPQSKAAKTQKIIDLMQYGYNLLPPERWLELLDIGSSEKMITQITAAIDTAEAENDLIVAGTASEVSEWEDDVLHLSVHYKFMQKMSFKDIPIQYRNEFIEHVTDHEYQAYKKMQQNPMFEARLAQLQLFPMFYTIPAAPQSAEQKTAIVNGQANMGAPVTEQIPASPAPMGMPGMNINEKK